MTLFRGTSAVQRGSSRDSLQRSATHVCLGLLLGLLAGEAGAEPSPADLRMTLHIPAQDLAPALDQYSRATGVAVLVDSQLSRGRRSLAVDGEYTAAEALRRLLGGSGLMARYARADAFTLQVAEVEDVPVSADKPSPASAALNRSYATAVQAAIERNLCRSPLTRPGSYRAVLQVWVGRDGVVQHNRLVTSTGDVRRDNALVESFRTLTIDRPTPSALRQPVTLLLLPESAGKRMECTRWEGVSGG
ncbi:TonB C-terminal domain-containing protein [Pseudomonas sp. SWRI81]|uniref:secretin and TonB N-terminal domain-containing protein n=1 Tax=Pseudomonas sp. SWRI81 TaxID=2745505 RepID=UPI001646805D|nr:secretin and TonB N-terminal domain-containing protein [Pseudomonas sp. SWRI81]MBC3270284.1 TonB C-terminal domain-containing protein [Pseudomonas sp. SWRI81]